MTSETTLRSWMIEVAGGDSESLAALYADTKASIYGLILAVLGTRDGAEDVLVETFVQVWRRASRYDPTRGSVRTWIAAIARRRAIDRVRCVRRGLPASAEPDDFEEVRCSSPTPAEVSLSGDEAVSVRRAVNRLDEGKRRAIEAIYFSGMTHVEAAEALRQPLGTVKGRVRAALTALRDDLGFREEGAG